MHQGLKIDGVCHVANFPVMGFNCENHWRKIYKRLLLARSTTDYPFIGLKADTTNEKVPEILDPFLSLILTAI
jgi:hypothetical protein